MGCGLGLDEWLFWLIVLSFPDLTPSPVEGVDWEFLAKNAEQEDS